MKIAIIDAEIKNAIPNKSEPQLEGIKYCDGWGDHEGMGISLMGAYDYSSKRYRVFCDDNKDEFIALMDGSDIVVSFNGVNFDSKLIKAAWGHDIPVDKHYDILRELRLALGLNPTTGSFRKGLKLDQLMQTNFGVGKTWSGALAPILWQRGQVGAVVDYLLNDIFGTKTLFDKIVEKGAITDPLTGEEIRITFPSDLPF